jgi:hypothetical protein
MKIASTTLPEIFVRIMFPSEPVISLFAYLIITLKLKSTIFRDITLCSLLKVNPRFGGTYHLHLQGRKISGTRNQCESWWGRYVPPKRRLTFIGPEDNTHLNHRCDNLKSDSRVPLVIWLLIYEHWCGLDSEMSCAMLRALPSYRIQVLMVDHLHSD